ncbi:LysR family transcriptional regulator [Arenibacter algicola]|mgnify:FL=1|uniref:DNA-binding transcriptional regulator, LysR family n=2 Tax=Arenibacter TaxID=178469 RepID=A0A1M4Y4K7_9FLAO|nr:MULTISPECIES: LysR family transcriptional regulator [Arenibacter]MBC8769644.1 LysR family transcriptional regulator [Arenibacter arenosicollis]MBU2905885.1 LysR family transcriptional regulator [Arenibacter algicola]SHF00747.1 DNA-binding transcriptional regulator, LysR family [Arenibacter palladensis]|tara:strand:- start:4207 stop:5100 length:894 start_codon:yes stop_codon:yes gene_type:complete
MFDFRLKVFHTVARRLNFTKAAEELLISQPAVTKHIKELESQFNLALFDRRGNKVILSRAGEVLLKHTENIQEIYRQIEFDLNQFNEAFKGVLHVGSSTSITQYILPPLLARFHAMHQDVKVELFSGNSEQIEMALLNKSIELGVVEGKSKRREIHYSPFLKDEIVLVCGSKNPMSTKEEIRPENLKNIPLLLREPGSGTLEVIADALKQKGIRLGDLKIEMQLGSTEAIKSYLQHSDCMAFVSLHAIFKELKSGVLKIIEIKKLPIHRQFYFITPQGPEGGLSLLLMNFLRRNHNF